MSIYDWQRLKTEPTEAERNRQEQNKRLYDIATGRIAEETERDSEEFAKFFSDLAVYSTFYEKKDTTAYAQYAAEEEAKKRSQQQNEQAILFVDKMIENSSGLTPRGKELRDELGLAAPVVGIDYDTGNIGYRDVDPRQAQDLLAYGRENMLALSGVEQASIYKTTRLYTAGGNIFGTLEDQFPEIFPKPTPEEQSNIDRALTFQGSWDRLLDVIPFVDGRTEGSQNVDTNFIFLENVRAWWDEGILPTDFLGGAKQEGWDGKQAWRVLSEYHPDFAAYLTNVAGLNPEMLANTPNHWEFRYMINESIDLSNLSAILENDRRDSSAVGYALDWGWNFLRQSFRSADMPIELALTAASFGAYGGIAGATIGMRGVKALKVANSVNDQVQTLNNINKLSQATINTNRIIHGARTTQALMVPSNWGSIAASSLTQRLTTGGWGLVTEGVRWGTEYNLAQRFLYMVPVDATQGLVEGFLYGLQNQLTDNMSFSGERLWQETYSEAFGQIIFGPAFRTTNLAIGKAVESTNASALGPVVWNIASQNINPNLKKMIELQTQLTNKDLSLDQIEQAYFGAYLTLHQHTVWQNMTDNTDAVMPPHVMQAMVVLQSAARQKGINVDLISISRGVLESLPKDPTTGKNVVLEEEEAALLLYGATLDQMSERGLTITEADWDIVNRQIAIQFLVADKMEEMGISRMQQAQMMSEDPAKYKEEIKKAYAAVLLETNTINQKLERLAEVGKSAIEKTGITPQINVVNTTQQAVSILEAFRTDDGEFDTTLIKEIFENARTVQVNISQETFNKVLDFARASEEASADRAAVEEPAEAKAPAASPAPASSSKIEPATPSKPGSAPDSFNGQKLSEIRSPEGKAITGKFYTEQGSEYIQDENGRVRRIKSHHSNTGGADAGLHPWGAKAIFTRGFSQDPSKASDFNFAVAKLLEQNARIAISPLQSGRLSLLIWDTSAGTWRAVTNADVFPSAVKLGYYDGTQIITAEYSSQPQMGWNVLELSFHPDGVVKSAHPGSKVSHIETSPAASPAVSEAPSVAPMAPETPATKDALSLETDPTDVKVDAGVVPVESPRADVSPEAESLNPPIAENLSKEVVQQPTNLEETLTSADNIDREEFLRNLRDDPEFKDCL